MSRHFCTVSSFYDRRDRINIRRLNLNGVRLASHTTSWRPDHARQGEIQRSPPGPVRATEFDDPQFLARLRLSDTVAYRMLVRRFHASLVRFAASIIGSHAQAEEVVQDAWLAVFAGVGRFEERSSLVTWIFSIVMNRARTRVSREGRLVGLGALMEGTSPSERGVPLSEFESDGHWAEAAQTVGRTQSGADSRGTAALGSRSVGHRPSARRSARRHFAA
jgi:DNA-directed RNA polymerase specialized sigma24 family protein